MRKIEDITEIMNELRKKLNSNEKEKIKYFIKNNKIMFINPINNILTESMYFKIIKNKNKKCLKCKYFSICKTIVNGKNYSKRKILSTNTMQCKEGEEKIFLQIK